GFVFACFNNNYKITPDVFDIWMRLLSKIPNSVLWLFEGNTTAAINLRKEAEKRGIAGDRLIFAKRMQLKDHLARHKLADLFLDTFYCNAHTTASDALWAGLPVLTCVGQTFAGRVAGSLLNAIGLSELITETLEQYESLAFEFATNPEKLSAIKNKLSNNRLTSPLFDAALFTQHIEASYTKMMERLLVGLPPDHIHIKD
ncbi:MAG: O-linked N-acetylglucosamine transferase family protein, partial [Burkholderiaceae bacterium]